MYSIIVVFVKPFVSLELVALPLLLPLWFALTPYSDQKFGVKDFLNEFKP